MATLESAVEAVSVPPIDDQLGSHFEAMARVGPAAAEAERTSLRALQQRPEAVGKLVEMYEHELRLSSRSRDVEGRVGHARVRWHFVHLLGDLRNESARDFLRDVTEAELPAPRESEQVYEVEYTIRLRAIDGLRKLGAISELESIYRRGGVLEAPASLALAEAGHAPRGVKRLDLATTMGRLTPTLDMTSAPKKAATKIPSPIPAVPDNEE